MNTRLYKKKTENEELEAEAEKAPASNNPPRTITPPIQQQWRIKKQEKAKRAAETEEEKQKRIAAAREADKARLAGTDEAKAKGEE